MRIAKFPPFMLLPILLIAALLPALASAQMPPGGAGRPHESRGNKGMASPRAEPGVAAMVPLADQVEEQLGMARKALNLTPTQLPGWQEFEIRAAQLVADLQRWKQRTRLPTDNIAAPLAVEKQIDVTRNQLTALEDLSTTMRQLYGALSEDQKQAADKRLPAIVGLLVNGGDVPADFKDARAERARQAN